MNTSQGTQGLGESAGGLGPSDSQKKTIGNGRPIWVIVVVVLYALAFIGPLGLLISKTINSKMSDAVAGWIILAITAVSQAGLLFIPVRVASRRPVRRGSLWFPLIASGVLLGCLVMAVGFSIAGLLQERVPERIRMGTLWTFLVLAVGSWIAWVVVFYRMSASSDPTGIGFRLHQALLKGSILELLIAVPAHIIERQRDLCSANAATFLGVCTGISVMFVAFGPAVFILYVRRCMKLQPAVQSTLAPEQQRRRVLVWSVLAGLAALLFLALLLFVGLFPDSRGLLMGPK